MAVNLSACVLLCVLGLALPKGITVSIQLALRARIRPELDFFVWTDSKGSFCLDRSVFSYISLK